jgi:hypothetical protein
MATIAVAGNYLAHDAGHIHAFGAPTDLIVSAISHLHDAAGIGNLSNRRIWPNDGWHDHVCFHIYDLPVQLVVAEAYHSHLAEVCNIAWGTLIYIDPLSPTHLPNLKIDSRSGFRVNCPPQGIRLPGFQITAAAGARLDDAALPVLACSATISIEDKTLSVDEKLPVMSLSANVGAKLDKTLPAMQVTASIIDANRGYLDRKIPPLSISATGSSSIIGTLTKDLPPLEIAATAIGSGNITLDAKLPTLKITASVLPGGIANLAADLPAVKAVALTGTATTLTLTATLPTLVMRGIGTGVDSPQGAKAVNESRFDDYLLRYSRF